jgi:hypothetical protein
MDRISRFAGIVILPVLVCSCATNRVDSDLRGAVVRVEPDSVAFEQIADMTRFKVNVIIRNDRATPLYFGGCGPEAQQEINGRWQTVWSPVCISLVGGSVAPRDSVTFPFSAARFTQRRIEPSLDPRATAGRYRIRYGATYDGPLNVVYFGNRPPPVTLRDLTTPVFIVYWAPELTRGCKAREIILRDGSH